MKPNDVTELAWKLFRSAFKDGDDVIVETSWGRFLYGKLKAEENRIVLTRPSGLVRVVPWRDVELVAHDGFPVKNLFGMSEEEAEARAKMRPRDIINEFLVLQGDEKPGEVTKRADGSVLPSHGVPMYYGGGCPFIAGPARLVGVHNRGNTGEDFWDRDDTEILVFEAADGALMHSYDSDHLFPMR